MARPAWPPPTTTASSLMGWFAGRGHGEAEHHAALHVLGNMAVGHPQPRVGDVEQDVHHLAGADQHGVLPDQVGLGHPVAGQDQEPPGAVQVEGVVHGVIGVHLIHQLELDPLADPERQSMLGLSAPLVRSRNLQCMVALVVSRLTSTMSSSHSIPPAAPSPPCPGCSPWPSWAWPPCSMAAAWPPSAIVAPVAASSFMPHLGQRPGSWLVTSGCMGQA